MAFFNVAIISFLVGFAAGSKMRKNRDRDRRETRAAAEREINKL